MSADRAVRQVVDLWPLLPACDGSGYGYLSDEPRILAPLMCRILDQDVALNVVSVKPENLRSPDCVCLGLGRQGERLHVRGCWLNELCGLAGLAGPDPHDWSTVAPGQRRLILAWLLEGLFGTLQVLLNSELALEDDPAGCCAGSWRRFELGRQTGETEPVMWLDLPARVADILERQLTVREDASWLQVPFAASLQAGDQTLRLTQLRSLASGDVVLLRRPLEDLQLALPSGLRADVRNETKGLVLASNWYIDERREVTVETIHTQEDVDDVDMLDQLTVQLVCEVGRLSLTLAELKSLRAGSVLSMGRRSQQAVDLIVNGSKIGQGELVRLDDSLGVRIVRMAKSHG